MTRISEEISRSLDKNYFVFKNLDDLEQDMKDYLDATSTICYTNCSNIDVIIDNKINKIIVKKCEDMNFTIKGLINGIEVENSEYVSIRCVEDLNHMSVDKSFDVSVCMSEKFYKKTVFDINKSVEISVVNGKGKLLKTL